MAWDYPEALELIAQSPSVAAVLCGHDHFGQYHRDDSGVHHCTFCSPLNKGDDGSAFGLIHVWDDAIEVCGPSVDDLLPMVRRGEPTGRPAKEPWRQGEGESVRLELRPFAPTKPGAGADAAAVGSAPAETGAS